ncbi:hypothetical protein A2U01_0025579 [Trifolium medium]|uniref:Uncharacterized protein n=1 Tax=Trifolium medium TaxID=97028 RepID=A0A392NYI3_9FABA|nr:hypothetical protein [Trifolium medium]
MLGGQQPTTQGNAETSLRTNALRWEGDVTKHFNKTPSTDAKRKTKVPNRRQDYAKLRPNVKSSTEASPTQNPPSARKATRPDVTTEARVPKLYSIANEAYS